MIRTKIGPDGLPYLPKEQRAETSRAMLTFSLVLVFLVQKELSSTWEPSSSGFCTDYDQSGQAEHHIACRGVDNSLVRIRTVIIRNNSSMTKD